MSKQSIVKKLMLPLEDYATVGENATLQEALAALAEAQKRVRPGRQPHRALMVQRSDGSFVGKLGYQAILGALRPKQFEITLTDDMRRAGVSEEMLGLSMASMQMLQEDLPNLCERAHNIKIREMLLPRPGTIDADAQFHVVLDAFVDSQAHSLLVVEGGDVIGVIRVSDIFDEVTRVALTCPEDLETDPDEDL